MFLNLIFFRMFFFFRFALALIVPEIMEVLRSDVRESGKNRKFCNFWLLEATILTLVKK